MRNFNDGFLRYAQQTVSKLVKLSKSVIKLLKLLDDVGKIVKPIYNYYL